MNIRHHSQQSLLHLFKQMKQRLPENIDILRNVSVFSVKNVLQPVKQYNSLTKLIEFMGSSAESISAAEIQLRKIHLIDWKNNNDTELFWSKVYWYKDAHGYNTFKELSDATISTLILSNSNAKVERIFSAMSNVKSKSRNKMELPLLSSILTVKFGLARHNKCCHNYKFPYQTLEAIDTLSAYSKSNTDKKIPLEDNKPQLLPSTSNVENIN